MTDIVGYMNHVYKWNPSHVTPIYTKYATNENYQIKYDGCTYFLKLYASPKSYATEKWFLDSLLTTGCTPQVVLGFEGTENFRASIILPYYSNFKPLNNEYIKYNDLAFDIGKTLKKVHLGTKTAKYFGQKHSERFDSWREYLQFRLQKIKMLYQQHNIPIVKKAYNMIENSFSDMSDNIVPSFVHSDLNPDNILYDSESKKIIIIDFERGYLGHFEMDFPKLFWRCFNFDPYLIKSFYEGYGVEPNPKSERLCQSIFFIDLLSYLINVPHQSKEDMETQNEILKLLEKSMFK